MTVPDSGLSPFVSVSEAEMGGAVGLDLDDKVRVGGSVRKQVGLRGPRGRDGIHHAR